MCTKCVRLGKDKEPLGLHNAASRRRGQVSRRPAPSTSKTFVVVHDATRESPVVEVAMTIDMLGENCAFSKTLRKPAMGSDRFVLFYSHQPS